MKHTTLKLMAAVALIAGAMQAPLNAQAPGMEKSAHVGTMQTVSVTPGTKPSGLEVWVEAKRELKPKAGDTTSLRYLWARTRVKNTGKTPVSGKVRVHFGDPAAMLTAVDIPVRMLQPGKTAETENTAVEDLGVVKRLSKATWEWLPQ